MESNYRYYMSEIRDLMSKTSFVTFQEKQHVCRHLGIDGNKLLPTDIDVAIREAVTEDAQLLDGIYRIKSDNLPEMEKIVRCIFDLRMSLLRLAAAGYENLDLLSLSEELGTYWFSLSMDLGETVEAEYINSLVRICENKVRSGFWIPVNLISQIGNTHNAK